MEADYTLNGNFRPLQQLNGRKVEKSPDACMRGSTAATKLTLTPVLFTFALSWIFQSSF